MLIVPVMMGGSSYSKLAVPGSYINIMDFSTVTQLAEYLQCIWIRMTLLSTSFLDGD